MKTFSRDWNMFTAGFIWAFACGMFVAGGSMALSYSFSIDKAQEPAERTCQNPIVEMAEYRTVVHSLDRCHWRLDEEQQDNFQMKDAVDHWDYISRLVNSANPEVQCMLLIEQATRDFREQCEDDLYIVQEEVWDECLCPFPVEGLSELPR